MFMSDSLEVRVFQLKGLDETEIYPFLESCDTPFDEDEELRRDGDKDLRFSVSNLTGAHYSEFSKLPEGEPTLRVRVIPSTPSQIWVENKEALPEYIHDQLKEEGIHHIVYKPVWMNIDEFASPSPEARDIGKLEVECEYKG